MENIADKINSLLNDEESMAQIKELAEMFGGFGDTNSGTDSSSASSSSNSSSTNSFPGMNFSDILGGVDPALIMSIMSQFQSTDPSCELIMALRPHLSEEKRGKADKAVKMLKLYKIYISLKESGALKDLNLF